MTFTQSVTTCFQKYLTFTGRASRSEYWYFALFTVVVSTILSGFDYVIALSTEAVMFQHDLLGNLFSLAILIPSISVTTRRLHDIDKSGWWQLAWLGLLIVAGIALILGLILVFGGEPFLIIAAIMIIASIVWILLWMVRRSTDGDNRFGASYAQL